MRVLVISHNVFDNSNNMGRTLENQFQNFSSDEIAQLYFTKGVPHSAFCKEFFCISDSEVFHSIFNRKPAGHTVDPDCAEAQNEKTSDESIQLAIRKKGRRPITYLMRNMIWFLGKWKTKKLDEWLDKIDPTVIYYASGDYSFSYKVTMYIAKKRKIPVIIGCYDDFYIGKRKTLNPLYHLFYSGLMRSAKKLFKMSSCFMGLSEMMTNDYQRLFGKSGHTMFVPTEIGIAQDAAPREARIFYAGNLGYGRAEQLVLLGRAIKALGRNDIAHIDVYSAEIREELTSLMCEENGIVFHGKVAPAQVQQMMRTSQYVIHTESFMPGYKKRVKYSVSTKIADCLSCGACIVAFGPTDVASIDYLNRANAACVISDTETIGEKLTELFADEGLRQELVANAIDLSQKNHNNEQNCEKFKAIILDAARS